MLLYILKPLFPNSLNVACVRVFVDKVVSETLVRKVIVKISG